MPAKKTDDTVVKFEFEKETPGAFRYREIDDNGVPLKGDDAVMGSVYIRKTKLPSKPAKIAIVMQVPS